MLKRAHWYSHHHLSWQHHCVRHAARRAPAGLQTDLAFPNSNFAMPLPITFPMNAAANLIQQAMPRRCSTVLVIQHVRHVQRTLQSHYSVPGTRGRARQHKNLQQHASRCGIPCSYTQRAMLLAVPSCSLPAPRPVHLGVQPMLLAVPSLPAARSDACDQLPAALLAARSRACGSLHSARHAACCALPARCPLHGLHLGHLQLPDHLLYLLRAHVLGVWGLPPKAGLTTTTTTASCFQQGCSSSRVLGQGLQGAHGAAIRCRTAAPLGGGWDVEHGGPALVGPDPGVVDHLHHSGPVPGVLLQRLADEGLGQLRHLLRELRCGVHDLVHRVKLGLTCKWWEAHHQLVCKHAHSPCIHTVVVVQVGVILVLLGQVLGWAAQDLRGHVVQCASSRDCPLLVQVNRQTKVRELEHSMLREQHVLGLNVAVHDAARMQVVQGEQEGVQHHLHRLPLAEAAAVLVQQAVKVTALRVLLNQDHVGALLEGGEEVDDVLVLQARVHSDLAVHLVVVELTQVLHVVHLERHLLPTLLARGLVHCGCIACVHLAHDAVVAQGPVLAAHGNRQVAAEGEQLGLLEGRCLLHGVHGCWRTGSRGSRLRSGCWA
mmetsp:Transcript_21320/g.46573  ORF Transcript_21320/g.46573 Transcript_21320/m.46573 type:complete len:602 (-) Transcript_21320:1145-2950(-)